MVELDGVLRGGRVVGLEVVEDKMVLESRNGRLYTQLDRLQHIHSTVGFDETPEKE